MFTKRLQKPACSYQLIQLHAVQFGNNFLDEKKFQGQPKLSQEFFNSIISKLDKLVVLAFINYIAG